MKLHMSVATVLAVLVSLLFAFLGVVAEEEMPLPSGGTITGSVKCPRPKLKKDCVVYIETAKGEFEPTQGAQIDQKGLVFIPHVLPVVKGATVNFLNHDDVRHNVFSSAEIAEKFNLGTWPPGEIKTYTFEQEGVAPLLCNVHAEMEGYVVVLQNPHFAVTDGQGNFTINGVPPGSYTLKVWNKKFKGEPKQIEVKEGENLQVVFELKL